MPTMKSLPLLFRRFLPIFFAETGKYNVGKDVYLCLL